MNDRGRTVRGILLGITVLGAVCCLAAQTSPHADINLLINAGFELGSEDVPLGWRGIALPGGEGSVELRWEEGWSSSGDRSVGIEVDGTRRGIWSQTVPVQPGQVYEFSGSVAFENLTPQSSAFLQIAFRDHSGKLLEFVDLARHTKGSRGFELDFPARMIVRAPAAASRAEVNGFLEGSGTAWFDDLVFAEAPVGSISGVVLSNHQPVEGARVYLWGDPWGVVYEAVSNADGQYLLEDVPVSHPRYIAIAEKAGFQTQPSGDLDVIAGEVITVDFDLNPGSDPLDTLKVGYGSISHALVQEQLEVPAYAPLPAQGSDYSDSLQPYLLSDAYITTNDPAVQALATEILETMAPEDRVNAVAVAWAVFTWISTHINHDAVYGNFQPYLDITSGIWQTIQHGGWCWGRSFYDWLYRPAELLEERTGICIEHSWLSAALLRALNIPARARVGSAQFWVSLEGDAGAWFGFSTNGGSNTYRETGRMGAGFGGSTLPTFFSADSEPFLHEDWDWEQPGLWREHHPWGEVYPAGDEGLAMARRDLAEYSELGRAPEGSGRRRPGEGAVEIDYAQIELNLWNLGTQRVIDVRFPAPTASEGTTDTGEWAYWTNHPECVVETYEEVLADSPTGIIQTWRHIVFDVSSLLGE